MPNSWYHNHVRKSISFLLFTQTKTIGESDQQKDCKHKLFFGASFRNTWFEPDPFTMSRGLHSFYMRIITVSWTASSYIWIVHTATTWATKDVWLCQDHGWYNHVFSYFTPWQVVSSPACDIYGVLKMCDKTFQLPKWEIRKYNLGWHFSKRGFVYLTISITISTTISRELA